MDNYICAHCGKRYPIDVPCNCWKPFEPDHCFKCLTIERGKCLLSEKCKYYDRDNLEKEIRRREQNERTKSD